MNIDVFNGDADGIFSLIQLRRYAPVATSQQQLITGVKRDHALLQTITDAQAKDAELWVLDLPFDKNSATLPRLLQQARHIHYVDHHFTKSRFHHERLTTVFDFSPTVCTGLLVSAHLGYQQHVWALPAAFGDNLFDVAYRDCQALGLSTAQTEQLRELGMLVNYNSYGATVADLHMHPAQLYCQLMAYESPFAVVADNDREAPFLLLQQGYVNDREQARNAQILEYHQTMLAIRLPATAWARRINGSLANELAQEYSDQAILIATENTDGKTFSINLRAPQSNRAGAGAICERYPHGGGRAGAGGINHLPEHELDGLLRIVSDYYSKGSIGNNEKKPISKR